ncbi:MAG: ABC transporter substrate-binding protein [Caldilineaceae bacterium]
MQRIYRQLTILVVIMLLLVACQSVGAPPANEAAQPVGKHVDADWPNMTWDEVLAEASGQTVNWYHWGGSDQWNEFVGVTLNEQAQELYNVTINPVHVNDTVEVVNKVLGEAEAGRNSDGSVDMIWINAENFITLQQADLMFGPYTDALPNVEYIDTSSGYYNYDAGKAINGQESLWGTSQMVIEYDSAVVNPPTNIDDFFRYVCDNPGKFTYPAPPDFTGTGFITTLLYHYTGQTDLWLGAPDEVQAQFDELSPALWEALNDIKPCLWRNGETYPNDLTELRELVKNGEIAFAMTFGYGDTTNLIADGVYPETMRTMMFDTGTVANAHYVAIPFNSPHKAAAMVIANLIQSPENQLALMRDVGGTPAVVVSRLPQEIQDEFAALDLGPAAYPLDQFKPALPQLGDMQPVLEQAWRANVLEK